MTEHDDTGLTEAQLDRVAQLRARRSQTAPSVTPLDTASVAPNETATAPPTVKRRRKRHVARGGRIVAAGLGATTLLGIVGVLGLDNTAATNETKTGEATPVVQHPAPPPIQVVVHRIPATRTTAPSQPATTASGDADATPAPAVPATPIVLTAQPVVRTVTVDAPTQTTAPAATTRGSN